MAPGKWDDEESEESSAPSSPAVVATRRKFDDEEDDGDVLDSWDAAEDSEVEREKAKKAAETKAKAEAEEKANKKSKTQRIEERRAENARRLAEMNSDSEDDDEDDAARRRRLRETEISSDLAHAEDLFGAVQVPNTRTVTKTVTLANPADPLSHLDLATLPLFNPKTKEQFTKLRETLVPLIGANSKHAQYTLFMQEFAKQICKELPSDQIKKIASGLTTLSNEKMKEEKALEKGGKKKKAATKNILKADRSVGSSNYVDTSKYDDDGLDDGDFM